MTTMNVQPSPKADNTPPVEHAPRPTGAATLSVRRINIMRIGYLVMGVGLAATKWPSLINRDQPWPLYEGVSTYILVAMGLLALLGLRYPVKMLPILVFESVWKVIWLTAVARPQWSAGKLDPATSKVASSCLWVVIILAVTPWRYVFAQYVTARGEPWRSDAMGKGSGRGPDHAVG
jgi:hypothetical protein